MAAGKTAHPWRRLTAAGLIAAGAVVAAVYLASPSRDTNETHRAVAMAELLSGASDTTGYARADRPRRFAFPDDHGPHPPFKHEWWYFTGNLSDKDGRRFGYQLTLFRIAMSPHPRPGESAWGTRQLYMAHFALTDAADDGFHAFQRFERGAMGLAGAAARPFHVWLDDWSVTAVAPGAAFPARLHAAQDGYGVNLTLQRGKPVVLEGDHGLSRKGGAPGNASYYYSLTRMPSRGTVRIGDRTFHVQGDSWMDREWSTSALAEDQAGWDWFALQLSDDREIMYYRLRNTGGGTDPHSGGTLVFPDGHSRRLSQREVRLTVLDHWQSPDSGIRYPAKWRLRVPGRGVDVTIAPLVKGQELNVAVTYWEGSVTVRGRAGGAAVSGYGYLEMTGYGAGR